MPRPARAMRERLGFVAGLCLAIVFALPAAASMPAAIRVVTLAPHLAELACAAGGCDRLAGVVAHSDYPASVATLPQVGDAFAINLEAVLALKPDLVLAWDGGTPVERVERLRKLGLRVEWVKVGKLDEIGGALEQLGAWLGTDAAAHAAAEAYRTQLAALRDKHRGDAPIRVVYQIETAPAYAINGQSPISEAMAICGGNNVFAKLPHLADSVGAEFMLVAAPEAVLYGGEENAQAMQAYWSKLSTVPAEKLGNLFPVDANLLTRATPRLIEGTEQVCSVLDEARHRRAASH